LQGKYARSLTFFTLCQAQDDVGLHDKLLTCPEVVFTSLEGGFEDVSEDLLQTLKVSLSHAEEPIQLGFLKKIIKDRKSGIAIDSPLKLSQDLASQPLDALMLPQDSPCLRTQHSQEEDKAEEIGGDGARLTPISPGGASASSGTLVPLDGVEREALEARDSRREGKEREDQDVGHQGSEGIFCADPVQEMNLDEELEAFMHTRGRISSKARSWKTGAARAGQDSGGKELDASASAAMALVGKRGLGTITVKIDSDTSLALTAFILRCIGCAVMSELVEQGVVCGGRNVIEATQDKELILAVAKEINTKLTDGTCVSSKQKARATASWSSLMVVYLLNQVHGHLIHSGPVVAGLFLESAMADPKWSSVMDNVAPSIIQKEVIDRLEAMRSSNQQHPKLIQLRAMVAQHSRSSIEQGEGKATLTIVLVKSSVSFPDISKAIYGLQVSCESKSAADLDKTPPFSLPKLTEAHVWVTTEQAMLKLLASCNAPPGAVLDAALVILTTKPSVGMELLLERGNVLKHAVVLDTVAPFIEAEFLLSGAQSYRSQVQVQAPLEKLWVDAQEEAAAQLVLHRSVKLVVYAHEHLLQRRDLVQSLLEENVHMQDLSFVGCDIVVSRFTCIVMRTLHELFGNGGSEFDDSGINGVVTHMVELSRAYEKIVLLVEMNDGPADVCLDASAWIKLYSLSKSYGAAVKVVQVLSVDELALSIRMAIEEDCGSREVAKTQRPPQQQNCAELASLDALKAWGECLEQEPSHHLRFLCAWPSLNPVSTHTHTHTHAHTHTPLPRPPHPLCHAAWPSLSPLSTRTHMMTTASSPSLPFFVSLSRSLARARARALSLICRFRQSSY
jgi:hypothetical protein